MLLMAPQVDFSSELSCTGCDRSSRSFLCLWRFSPLSPSTKARTSQVHKSLHPCISWHDNGKSLVYVQPRKWGGWGLALTSPHLYVLHMAVLPCIMDCLRALSTGKNLSNWSLVDRLVLCLMDLMMRVDRENPLPELKFIDIQTRANKAGGLPEESDDELV